MDNEPRLADFVDYRDIFSRALTRVGRGQSIPSALEECSKESYPHAYRDVLAAAHELLDRLKELRGWGSLRALRELASDPILVEELRRADTGYRAATDQEGRRTEVFADFPRIFTLAQRKRKAGYSLEDSVEMAVRELYPQTYRKTKHAALEYVREAASKLGTHELRALRELAEDPALFRSLLE